MCLPFRASPVGYATAVKQVTVDHDQEVTLDLLLGTNVGAIDGAYLLTVIASPSCRLPAEARQRTYTADIGGAQPSGRYETLWISLTGAVFMVPPYDGEAGFYGSFDGNTVRFTINDDISTSKAGNYAFVERAGDGAIACSGAASDTITDRTILTTFDGRVRLWDPTTGATVAECRASDHRLEFTR